ncbi:hypothetical protein [Ferrimonas pelagia]|uniref:DUF2946 domain-containing protein n=1 Tax=Ferrimonas pelagia TaxID=1177826 RepID=A0ABP9F8V1_9GAMM
MRQTIVALILMLFAQTALAGLGGHQWHLSPADNSHAPDTHQHIKLDGLSQFQADSGQQIHDDSANMELCTQCGCHSGPSAIIAESSMPSLPQAEWNETVSHGYLPPALTLASPPPIA